MSKAITDQSVSSVSHLSSCRRINETTAGTRAAQMLMLGAEFSQKDDRWKELFFWGCQSEYQRDLLVNWVYVGPDAGISVFMASSRRSVHDF